MILKTNPLRPIVKAILAVSAIVASPHAFGTYNAFECLRDIMPITDRAAVQNKRGDVEEPFLVNNKFIVFPEVSNLVVTGFFFYGQKGAAYYDAAEVKGSLKSIGDLAFKKDDGIYELIAQPEGLETVTVHYLPGFKLAPGGKNGPMVLGATVLPVIGAFVSRPDMIKVAYQNPKEVNDIVVKKWMSESMGERRPASVDDIKLNATILRLKTIQEKSHEDLWKPFKHELRLRKNWIQTHNLDEKAFKQLSLILEGTCKE